MMEFPESSRKAQMAITIETRFPATSGGIKPVGISPQCLQRSMVRLLPRCRRVTEPALVSGNRIHGAMGFGLSQDETDLINHGVPFHKPLPPSETATIIPEIRH